MVTFLPTNGVHDWQVTYNCKEEYQLWIKWCITMENIACIVRESWDRIGLSPVALNQQMPSLQWIMIIHSEVPTWCCSHLHLGECAFTSKAGRTPFQISGKLVSKRRSQMYDDEESEFLCSDGRHGGSVNNAGLQILCSSKFSALHFFRTDCSNKGSWRWFMIYCIYSNAGLPTNSTVTVW